MGRFTAVIVILIIITPSLTLAGAPKGFHEGPYLRIIGGLNSVTFDNNARTGAKTGSNYHGGYGFQFGWNLWDEFAPELEVRYTTTKVRDNREHLVNVNLNIKYSFVTHILTKMKHLQILPFVQGGPTGMVAAVPGDPESNDKFMPTWGLGVGAGAGVDFLIIKNIYAGILIQADIYYVDLVHQNVNGVNQTILAGGWEPQLGVMGAAGVHF